MPRLRLLRWRAVAVALCLGGGSLLAADGRQAPAAQGAIESTAFAARSAAMGPTLFATVPSAQSGIRALNRYDDPRMWTDLFERFAYGSMGTGVAIGDYDGDGRADVFVVCKTGPNHLFRNRGDWRFEDVTERAGVGGPRDGWYGGVCFVDVNNDGRLDLYVCRVGAANLLYVNQGDGTFRESAGEAGIDVTDASVMGAFCDYDRDGWLDLYLVTNLLDHEKHAEGQRDYLFHNRGDGTFEDVTARAGIFGEGQKHAAMWGDYDGDEWPDVYVTYDYGWPDQLFRNNRDGTFTNTLGAALPHIPRFSMGCDLGDVNNDGRLDLFVPDMLPTTRERDQRAMIDARAHIAEPTDPTMTPQQMHNALFLNTGAGRFLDAAFLANVAATDWTWSPRLEDLDEDGRVDLFITNGSIREFFDGDLRRRLEGLAPAERKRMFRDSPVLRERNLALRNAGDLEFQRFEEAWGLDHLGVSFGAAFGDLDGDGDLDLVFSNFEGEVTVCRNDTSALPHHVVVALRGTRSNRFGVGATVRIETDAGTQVRQLAIARGYMSSSEPVLHFGLGDETRLRRLTVAWPSGRQQSFAQLPADRRYLIHEPSGAAGPSSAAAAAAPATQFVEVSHALGADVVQAERLYDELADQPLLALRQQSAGPGAAVGDLNNDGADDVVIAASSDSPVQVLLANAQGAFSGRAVGAKSVPGGGDAAPLLLDVNGDGVLDLVLAPGGAAPLANDEGDRVRVLVGDGRGGFQSAGSVTLPSISTRAGPVVAGDFDRDGSLDLFVGGRVVPGRYGETPASFLLRHRAGGFDDVTDALAPGLRHAGRVSAALASDVDGDGWLDLVLALQWGGIRYWHNREGKTFEDWSDRNGFSSAGSGWWNSIAAVDLNGDRQPDYIVGNVGLNTPYHAAWEQPLVLLTGELDQGKPALIEAQPLSPLPNVRGMTRDEIMQRSGRQPLFPLRGRSSLVRVMPWLERRAPSFKAYAGASVDDLFGADRVSTSPRLVATELASGVLLSDAGGSYSFRPLPRIAQIAPVFGIACADFNGDGHADVFVAQNSYAPIAELGRFDGGVGQLLFGDGHGNLSPVAPQESGLVVTGDAKAAALLDLDRDGWPEILVTRNGERALLFGNTGAADRVPLRIRLRGPGGNPAAVGARITLELRNDVSQTAEVYAASGYASQSTDGCFFAFPRDNPPRHIRVRWPSGEQTGVVWRGQTGTMTIPAPAR